MMSEWSEKPATVNDTMNSVTQECFVSCRFFPGVYSACTEMYSINAFFFFYELVHGDGDGIGIWLTERKVWESCWNLDLFTCLFVIINKQADNRHKTNLGDFDADSTLCCLQHCQLIVIFLLSMTYSVLIILLCHFWLVLTLFLPSTDTA